ncbi:MAG: 30S ribosomal protein S8 [Candidatus Saccharimonadales bacterium]
MSTSTDPIADMLARIRNAINVRKSEVSLPYSNSKEAVARLLADNQFIVAAGVSGEGVEKVLQISLNNDNDNAHITEISRLSKPGRRQYTRAAKIPTVKRGRGIVIISTSRGMMTGSEAKKLGIGGELICEVY